MVVLQASDGGFCLLEGKGPLSILAHISKQMIEADRHAHVCRFRGFLAVNLSHDIFFKISFSEIVHFSLFFCHIFHQRGRMGIR